MESMTVRHLRQSIVLLAWLLSGSLAADEAMVLVEAALLFLPLP